MPDLTTLTARVLKLLETSGPDAMDLLYDEVDDTLLAGRIDDVATWLLDASQFPLVICVGALTITNRWHPTLEPGRRLVAERVRMLDPARAEKLLRGFFREEPVGGGE